MGRIGRATGAEQKHSKLVSPETKIWLQGGHTKVVITRWSYQGSHNNKLAIVTFEPKTWMPFPGIGSTETFVVKVGHSPIIEK